MITIDDRHSKKRLDTFLLEYLHEGDYKTLSRSFLKENWGDLIKINDRYLKVSYKLKVGDKVEVILDRVEELVKGISNSTDIKGEVGELEIFFEDDDFLVLNKPKGMVVHPGIGNREDTLANRVKGYLESKGEFDNGVDRAGIVHRLDKGVSGLIIFAKTVISQRFLQKQFEEHRVKKVYLAKIEYKELEGSIKAYFSDSIFNIQEEIDNLKKNNFVCDNTWYKMEGYIKRSSRNRVKMSFQNYKSGNGKYALSYIKPINEDEILVMIETGRMHQIRASLEYLGIHIKGDTLYGSSKRKNMPNEIELSSILLSFKDMNNRVITICKI